VVLRIDEGRVERVWTVRFVGNDPSFVTDARLKTLIKSKPGYFNTCPRQIDSNVIEEDRERLVAYYRGLGTSRPALTAKSTTTRRDNGHAHLRHRRGPRYRIRDMSVVGNKKFDSQQLLDQLKLQQGSTSIWTNAIG